MSQNEMILKHMKSGWITPKEALDMYGCMRLASRIGELSVLHDIERRFVTLRNGKRVMEYRLKRGKRG